MATTLEQQGRQALFARERCRQLCAEDLSMVERWRPNILITGAPDRTADALDELSGCMRLPVARWLPGKALDFPADASTATLILTEPSLTSLREQDQLLSWIRTDGRTVQVITITSVPLFGLIANGTFSPELYYHLNVVHFELGS